MKSAAAIAALSALAQDTRLSVFRLLVRHEPDGLTVGEIATELGLAPATLSFHLKALVQAGLVESVPEGRFLRCRAQLDTMNALTAFLADDCCGGRPELCAAPTRRRSPARKSP